MKLILIIILSMTALFGCASHSNLNSPSRIPSNESTSKYEIKSIFNEKNYKEQLAIVFKESALTLNKTTIEGDDYFFYTQCEVFNDKQEIVNCKLLNNSTLVFPYNRINSFMGAVTDQANSLSLRKYDGIGIFSPVTATIGIVIGTLAGINSKKPKPTKTSRRGLIGFITGAALPFLSIPWAKKVATGDLKKIDFEKLVSKVNENNDTQIELDDSFEYIYKSLEIVSAKIKLSIDSHMNETLVIKH